MARRTISKSRAGKGEPVYYIAREKRQIVGRAGSLDDLYKQLADRDASGITLDDDDLDVLDLEEEDFGSLFDYDEED